METNNKTYAEIALPLRIANSYTYRLPDELSKDISIGSRVLVPLGKRELTGYVVDFSEVTDLEKVKDIFDVLDDEPVLSNEMLDICKWIAEYYFCSIGQVIKSVLPTGLTRQSEEKIRLLKEIDEDAIKTLKLTASQVDAMRLLTGKSPRTLKNMRNSLVNWGFKGSMRHLVDRLEKLGLIEIEKVITKESVNVQFQKIVTLSGNNYSGEEKDALLKRSAKQRVCLELIESLGGSIEMAHLTSHHGFSSAVIKGLEKKDLVKIHLEERLRDPYRDLDEIKPPRLTLTKDQKESISEILQSLKGGKKDVFLLHGITGSGKTQVYIEVLNEALKLGKGAIVLVPEISLTPQAVSRFKSNFGPQVAVLHSMLSDGERFDAWRRIKQGELKVVVGARSAIFAPVQNLGVIVVDEEQESSYKQNDTPRYHAREVAIMRARQCAGIVILGSATPSLESYHNSLTGKYKLLGLPERIAELSLPPVEIVDLRDERVTDYPLIFSHQLMEEINDRTTKGEQVILLLNRRGYSTFVQCYACGHVFTCQHCNISLTFHKRPLKLICHYCDYQEHIPDVCPDCLNRNLDFKGLGTQQVEKAIRELFPTSQIARMDMDTTSGKWSHQRILDQVEIGKVDILLGTQMIAKGLDFPNVTLVGVISADTGINLPDFRASEKTFQLLTQVAGRAGRGPKGGKVIIQTYLPFHPVVTATVKHDYSAFSDQELKNRKETDYPPFSRLVNLLISGKKDRVVIDFAKRLDSFLDGLWVQWKLNEKIQRVGPAPCPLTRIRGRYRWHLLFKSKDANLLQYLSHYILEKVKVPSQGDCRLILDRDPVSLL